VMSGYTNNQQQQGEQTFVESKRSSKKNKWAHWELYSLLCKLQTNTLLLFHAF
jgi:hypothetical protein